MLEGRRCCLAYSNNLTKGSNNFFLTIYFHKHMLSLAQVYTLNFSELSNGCRLEGTIPPAL